MKILFLICSFLSVIPNAFSANTLDSYVTINRFFDIETKQAYVEVSYLVPISLVKFAKNNHSKYQAKLIIDLQIRNNNKLLAEKVYVLQSNEYNDLNGVSSNLKDVVRLFVPQGDTLNLQFKIEDVNDSLSHYKSNTSLYIPQNNEVFLSDIMLISAINYNSPNSVFSRNNIEVLPKFMNYYPTNITEINFYCEFYQTKKMEDYLVRYLITNEEGIYVDGYAGLKRIEEKPYDAIVSGFNLEKLPSGNYYLYIELKNDKNEILERKRTFFQRNNKNKVVVENINTQKNELEVITNNFAKKYNLVNIRHHILALKPIAGAFEKATIESFEKSEDIEQMQNYFFSFWKTRNKQNPEAAWKAYAEKLQYVESTFTNITERGYETPMGIVYLMYGEPFYKELHRKRDKKAFWVWNYEMIDGQGNVYFIFQNFDNISDDFRMVHTSLKGQLFDKTWAEFIKNDL